MRTNNVVCAGDGFFVLASNYSVRLEEMLKKVFKLGAVSASYARIFKGPPFLLNKECRWDSDINVAVDGMRRVIERKR
jgi:hypothetical protein